MPEVLNNRVLNTSAWILGFTALTIATSKVFSGSIAANVFNVCAGFLLIGSWLFVQMRNRTSGLPRTGLEIPVLFFLVALSLSLGLSPLPRAGIEPLAWLFFGSVLFWMMTDCFLHPSMRSGFVTGLLIVTGFLLFSALLETYAWYLNWWAQAGSRQVLPPVPYRFMSLINSPNLLMMFANLAAPLAVVQFLKKDSRTWRIAGSLWLVMYLFVLPFSSSRGGWLGAAAWICTLMLFWLSGKQRRLAINNLIRRQRVKVMGGGLVFALAGGIGAFYFYKIFAAANPTHGNPFSLNREHIWAGAITYFKSSPWFGVGPGQVGLAYLLNNQTYPTQFWPWNAHSTLHQVLAESGLIGFLALVVLIGVTIFQLVRAYRATSVEERPYVWAVWAGLASMSMHGLFEDYTFWPILVTVPILLTAYNLAAAKQIKRFHRIPIASLTIPTVLLGGLALFQLWSSIPAKQGATLASQGNWSAAARKAEVSIQRDPWLPLYYSQAGLSWARAWQQTGDPADLEQATQRLSEHVSLEPDNSILFADLAVLEWQSGFQEQALLDIQKAIVLSPGEFTFPLNYGWFLEMSGYSTKAVEQYRLALSMAPGTATHPFWSATPLRKSLVKNIQSPSSMPVWRQAQAEVARDNLDEARKLLALSAANGENNTAIQVSWAQYYAASEDAVANTKAIEDLPVRADEFYWNFYNILNQYYFYFGRGGIPTAVVPGYLKLNENVGQYPLFEQLYQAQVKAGQCSAAKQTWQVLQRELTGGELPKHGYPPAPDCP